MTSDERTPLLNRVFGGGARYRVTELVRRRTERLNSESIESGERGNGLKKVLEELEQSGGSSQRNIVLGVFLIVNHFITGVLSMMFLESWSFYDAAYFCIVTLTTVGYGDLSPSTTASKLFVIYYVIISIGIVSSYIAYFVGLFIDRQEEILVARTLGPEEEEPQDAEARILAGTELDRADYTGMAFSGAFMLGVLVVGCCIFIFMEKMSLIDALYATVISATTVGFGDLRPTHADTKLFMTVWLVFSTIAVAKLIGDFTDARVKYKQQAMTRRILTAQLDRRSLDMLDQDKDGHVEYGEFLSTMLVSCGKISQEELNTFRVRFNALDQDRDGKLCVNEPET